LAHFLLLLLFFLAQLPLQQSFLLAQVFPLAAQVNAPVTPAHFLLLLFFFLAQLPLQQCLFFLQLSPLAAQVSISMQVFFLHFALLLSSLQQSLFLEQLSLISAQLLHFCLPFFLPAHTPVQQFSVFVQDLFFLEHEAAALCELGSLEAVGGLVGAGDTVSASDL
jgi:hypothetical protein